MNTFFHLLKKYRWVFLVLGLGCLLAISGSTPAVADLGGSHVDFAPSAGTDGAACYIPGRGQMLCFSLETTTTDGEDPEGVVMKFPDDWTVYQYGTQTISQTCTDGGTFGSLTQSEWPQGKYVSDGRAQNAPDSCTAVYCWDVSAGTTTTTDVSVSWLWIGNESGVSPHSPCSNDDYFLNYPLLGCDEHDTNPPASVPVCTHETLTISPETIPNGVAATYYSQQFTAYDATGNALGNDQVSWSWTSTDIPGNCSLYSNTGELECWGNVNDVLLPAGTYHFTVYVYGFEGWADGSQDYTWVVDPKLVFDPGELPPARLTQAYSQTVTVSAGASPYALTLSSGTLPAGITFDQETDTFTGTPTETGTFPDIVIQAVDANGITQSITYSLTVLPEHLFTWDPAEPPEGGSATFTAISGYSDYTWYRGYNPGDTCESNSYYAGWENPSNIPFNGAGEYQVCLRIWEPAIFDYIYDAQWVTVTNSPPMNVYVNVYPQPSLVGDPVYPYVYIYDYSDGPYTCVVDWGDGSPTETVTSVSGETTCLLPSHTYETMGSFTIIVTVTEVGVPGSTEGSSDLNVVYFYAVDYYDWLISNTVPTTVEMVGYASVGHTPLNFTIATSPNYGNLGTPTLVSCELSEGEGPLGLMTRETGYQIERSSGAVIDSSEMSDAQKMALSAAVAQEPPNHMVCRATVLYTPITPDPLLVGNDSFTFSVNDGVNSDSNPATIGLWVHANVAPIAHDSDAIVRDTSPTSIVLIATDPDEYNYSTDNLTFTIDSDVSNGTLGAVSRPYCGTQCDDYSCWSECIALVEYIPNPGATTDSFTFHVNDSHFDSNIATVSVLVHVPETLHVNALDDLDDGLCDETHCSLREAVNAALIGDTIDFTFASGVLPATITLENGEIPIETDVTINGPGADQLAVSGGADIDDPEPYYHDRVFEIYDWNSNGLNSVTVTISELTIRDGRAGEGGGIIVGPNANVTLNDCIIGPNNVVTYAGGGIANEGGNLTLNRSTVVENHGTGSEGGAGIFSAYGTTSLINSTITGNITNNFGGGIYAAYGGTVNLIHSTVSGNTANQNYLDEPWGGGGGIYIYDATINIQNSIVAYNVDLTDPSYHTPSDDVMGTFTSLGGNLIGDGTGSNGWVGSDLVGTETEPIEPSLDSIVIFVPDVPDLPEGPWTYGLTHYFALDAESPAVDTAPTCEVSEDQRGVSRPQGSACDIGSYEREESIVNLPPYAPDYYTSYWTWPSTEPSGSFFEVPVMDPEGGSLTISYIEETDPVTEGVVGAAGAICYEPNVCYAEFYIVAPTGVTPGGSMYITFQYKVNDGKNDSNIATITLSFGADIPSANDSYQLAAKNDTTLIRIDGYGPTPLTFLTVSVPEHGDVGSPSTPVCEEINEDGDVFYYCTSGVIYTPDLDYEGQDSFAFVTSNGSAYSQQAQVKLWVAPNSAPTAIAGTATVSTVQPSSIMLEGSDPDYIVENPEFWGMHNDLTFAIVAPPLYGSLGTPGGSLCEPVLIGGLDYDLHCLSKILYTPDPETTETTDSFTFSVNDSHLSSSPATVSLTLRPPQTFMVNAVGDVVDLSGCDASHCSLREAIQAAVSGDTVLFDLVTPATITLTDQIEIDDSITIIGLGADQLTISGGKFGEDTSDIFEGGVFNIHAPYSEGSDPISVTIGALTIKDGRARYGGGLSNSSGSNLLLVDCVIGPNNVVTDAGGGIANSVGDITLISSTVVGNHGTGSLGGAGIFTENYGSITLINSTVTENVTNNFGGGILVWYESTVNLVHSTVSGNIANLNYQTEPWGGGGGIYIEGTGAVSIQNSIVADNIDMSTIHDKWPDVYGSFTSLGGNLIGDSTRSTGWNEGDLIGNAESPLPAMLEPLALNEPGTTPTFALAAGSPAIDEVACPEGIDTDQRGISRPLGSACDIGSYEFEPSTLTGELLIAKVFDPLASTFTGSFTIAYSCDDGTSGTVDLAAGGSDTITGIPLNTNCTVTEPTLPTPPTGWSFGLPTFYPETGIVTITEASPAYAEVTVTNTISRDTGTLTITKYFDPLTSGFEGTFAIDYDCDDGTAHDGTVNLAADTSETITGIPTGTICTITEPNLPTPPTGWSFGEPVFSPASGTVTVVIGTLGGSEIMAPATAWVTVTNSISRDLGELKISKVFDPLTSGFTGDFTITYDCDDDPAHDGTVYLAAGEFETISGIPTGTTCHVSEGELPAAPAGWSFNGPTYDPYNGTAVISLVPSEVVVTNTIVEDVVQTGELKITKVFDPLTSGYNGDFIVTYDCDDANHSGGISLAAGASQSVTGIPVGTTCTVYEVVLPAAPEGWVFRLPTFSPVSASVTISEPSPAYAEVVVTNAIVDVRSQVTTTRTKCSAFATKTAPDLENLLITTAYNKRTKVTTIKKVTPSAFYYCVKAYVPADASVIQIAQDRDSYPGMIPTVTLYDENCANLSPSLATVNIAADYTISINFNTSSSERIVYVGVYYTTRNLIGFEVGNPFLGMEYIFNTSLDGDLFTYDDLIVDLPALTIQPLIFFK